MTIFLEVKLYLLHHI